MLSLAHVHTTESESDSTPVALADVPRTLTDVVLHDWQGFDLHGLLADQPALRTVDVDACDELGTAVEADIASSWASVESISVYLEDDYDSTDQWVVAVSHSLVGGPPPPAPIPARD